MDNRTDEKEWRCFHCDEVFKTVAEAQDHFGIELDVYPGCVMRFLQPAGLPVVELGVERMLLHHYREAQKELHRYRVEDSDMDRKIHAMRADHQQALIRAEERGYNRGVQDMSKELRDETETNSNRG